MNINKTFIKIWNININGDLKNYQAIYSLIPVEWQLFLISDGSFTRNLSILKQDIISLNLIKQEKNFYSNKKACINNNIKSKKKFAYSREVYLVNIAHHLIFAKSYYKEELLKSQNLCGGKPLGLLLIESEVEIYREIVNIYCGYSRILEKKFKAVGPFWGRSYKILYQNKTLILIHEFFSPALIQII